MSILEQVKAIADALGAGWYTAPFDEDSTWRGRIFGPDNQTLFLSNTWGGKGRLYIGGMLPTFVKGNSVTAKMPSITVAETTDSHKIAAHIRRRLLPDYQFALSAALLKHAEQTNYAARIDETKNVVAHIIGGKAREGQDVVYGFGKADIQVTGPDSLRFAGHCFYFNADQLARMVKAVPELFSKEEAS